MMKHESESRYGFEISNEDYEQIEKVYNWYPIQDMEKDDIVKLYQFGGMMIIKSMLPLAEEAIERNNEKHRILKQIAELNERLEELKNWD